MPFGITASADDGGAERDGHAAKSTHWPISGVEDDFGPVEPETPERPAFEENALHYVIPAGIDDETDGEWRVTVNLVLGQWRFERYSGRAREWTQYEPIDSLQGGDARLEYARENSERQRTQKAAARVRIYGK